MKKIALLIYLCSFFAISQESKSIKILDSKLVNEIKLMYERDQLLRGMVLTDKQHLLTTEEKKILWKIQSDIDEYNTKRFIQIIREHGFVDSSNSNVKDAATYIILMHAPRKYYNDLQKLLQEERKKGNIDKSSYGLITWHIKGRPEPTINYLPTKENDSLNKQ